VNNSANTESRLYKEISVWKRVNDKVLLKYTCFHTLPENKYCVQSADFYNLPVDKTQIDYFFKQFIELLIEELPENRAGNLFNSLEEAISNHEIEFKSF
jgi:hypothetical protein